MKRNGTKYLKVLSAIVFWMFALTAFAQDITYEPHERVEVYSGNATNATKEIIGDYSFTDLESPNNRDGGAIQIWSIDSGNSSLTLTGNFQFIQNEAIGSSIFWSDFPYKNGGAVSATSFQNVNVDMAAIDDNGYIFFSENRASNRGGGIYAVSSNADNTADVDLTVGNNGNILFENNAAYGVGGGGIYLYGKTSFLSLNAGDMGNISFIGNSAGGDEDILLTSTSLGGGVFVNSEYGAAFNIITGIGGTIFFSENSAINGNGGGIGVVGRLGDATIDFAAAGDGKIIFSGNSSSRNGGAIFNLSNNTASKVNLTVGDNGKIYFVQNSTSNNGGGIYADGVTDTTVNLKTGIGGTILFFKNSTENWNGGGIDAMGYNCPATVNLTALGDGKIIFRKNSAKGDGGGGGIYVYSNNDVVKTALTVGDNGKISFLGNSAIGDGGGIYSRGSTASIDLLTGDGGSVFFSENSTNNSGGGMLVYSNSGDTDITINATDNGSISFSKNSADFGGGIYAGGINSNTTLLFDVGGNGSISFSENSAGITNGYGGGIHAGGATVTLDFNAGNDSDITFNKNISNKGGGGGIYANGNNSAIIDISVGDRSDITFSENSADSTGGAIHIHGTQTGSIAKIYLTAGDDGKILFSNNSTTRTTGGGININSNANTAVELTVGKNGIIDFTENHAGSNGGGIFIQSTNAEAKVALIAGVNGQILFSKNSAVSMGGGILAESVSNIANVNLTVGDNGLISFSENSSGSYGGGIYATNNGSAKTSVTLTAGNRSEIIFDKNYSINSVDPTATPNSYGGGISAYSVNGNVDVSLTVGNDSSIAFSENFGYNNGGGIYARSNNNAADISLSVGDRSNIDITDNMSHASGGALYISGNNNILSLSGGKDSFIVFRGNKQSVDVSEEGIPQNNTGVANAVAFTGKTTFNFNIDENGVIAFYDPIVTTASNVNRASVNLNDPASRADGDSTGTILLNGIDYIGKADANRYYNMVNDTVVYGGAFGVANNVIYGRNISELGAANPSTLTINDSVTLFSMQTLDGTIAVNNIINANVTNNGLLRFINQTPNSYHMLTINSLRGNSNIYMSFDSELGDTDVLNINTDAEGSHVVSALGTGSGTLERIENVIRVGDPTPEDIFTGGGVAGLYNYDLEQNLLGNWDLVRGAKNNNSDITIDSLAALSIGWFTQLSNLNKRLGQLHTVDYDTHSQDVWIRTFGGQVDSKLNVTNNIQFKEYNYGVDFGGDLLKLDKENRKGIVGIYGGYMRGDRKFTDTTGSIGNTISYYGGMYGTWINDKGLYFDLVTKVQDYRTSFTTDTESANFKNYGFGVSIETGKPYNFKNGYFVEPRVQLAYLHLNSSKFALGSNESMVRINDANIYRLLGGAKFGQLTSVGSDNKPFIWYVSADIEGQRSFGGRVDVVDESYSAKTDGIRSVFGLGIMYDDSDSSQLYINLESSFGEKYNRPWSVIGGYRKMF